MQKLRFPILLSALTLWAMPLTMQAQGILNFGLYHAPIGKAQVTQTSDRKIRVTNLGSSGQDGVTVDWKQSRFAGLHLADLNPDTLPVGAKLTNNVTYSGGGAVGNNPLYQSQMQRTATGLILGVDASAIGSQTQRVQILQDGVPVYTSDSSAQRIAVYVDGFYWGTIDSLWDLWDIWFLFAKTTPITVGTGSTAVTVNGNQVKYILDNSSNTTINNISSMSLTSKGVPSFTISGEDIGVHGLTHDALGNAVLHSVPDCLFLENLGSSGQDGVSVNLTQTDGMVMKFDGTTDLTKAGTSLTHVVRGCLGLTPNLLISTSHVTGNGTSATMNVDFSPLGATELTLQAFDPSGTILGSLIIPNGTDIIIGGGGTWVARPGYWGWKDTGVYAGTGANRHDVLAWTWFQPTCVGVGTGGTNTTFTNVARFTVEPTFGTITPDFVSTVEMTGANIPSVTIENEALTMFDQPHYALGDAQIVGNQRRLEVHNLGSSGQDGVSISLQNKASISVALNPVLNSFDLNGAAAMHLQAYGQANGIDDQPLGSLDMTRDAGSTFIQTQANFTALGAGTQLVQLYNQGTFVGEFTQNASTINAVSAWPINVGKLGGTLECFVVMYPTGTGVLINGAFYAMTEMRILAQNGNVIVGPKSRFDIRLANFAECDITGITTTDFSSTTLGGTVELDGILLPGGLAHQTELTLVLHPNDGTAPITLQTALQLDQTFKVTNLPRKGWDGTIKGVRTLAVPIHVDTTSGNATIDVSLPGGDADNSNSVDISDFAILVNNYGGHSGDVGYDDSADFNLDGTTDISDFSVLVNNYGSTGAP